VAGTRISTALAQLADRNGPMRSPITARATETVNVVGFNRLTIQGNPTANASAGHEASSTREPYCSKGLTFDLANSPSKSPPTGAQVTFDGVTVKNAQGANGINLGGQSFLGFTVVPARSPTTDSLASWSDQVRPMNVVNVTVSNKHSGQAQGSAERWRHRRQGRRDHQSGEPIFFGGTFVDAPVEIVRQPGPGHRRLGGAIHLHRRGRQRVHYIANTWMSESSGRRVRRPRGAFQDRRERHGPDEGFGILQIARLLFDPVDGRDGRFRSPATSARSSPP
jgi:hypothetical protein